MTPRENEERLRALIFARFDVMLESSTVRAMRRIEKTLHRWAEGECGDSHERGSWCIERDETGRPWHVYLSHTSTKPRRTPINDKEGGAIKRMNAITKDAGLFWHHQTDPRGCAVYIGTEPLTDENYNSGLAIYDI